MYDSQFPFSDENNNTYANASTTNVNKNERVDSPQLFAPVVKHNDNKKRNFRLLALAACIVCAVIGGITGGIISGSIIKKSIKTDSTTTVTQQYYQEQTQLPEDKKDENDEKNETTTVNSEENNIQSGTFTSSDDKPSLEYSFSAAEIYKYNVDSVVGIEVKTAYGTGYGTGFIINEDGYIVTNYHVVEDSSKVSVTLYDESVYTAEVIGYEESNDIAVIKITPESEIESLVYGVSSDLQVGDDVYVIGNPLGDLTFTLTTGVVSALNRLIDTGSDYNINMFQTDAAINSGNSGGPVFDKHGFVVGIASAKYASSSIEGLGFCVPIDDVRSMIDEIINKGYVSGKPLIGVSVYDKEISNFGFLQSQRSINGAKIAAIGENSPAAKAGLQIGDVIVAADGEKITSVSALRTVLADFRSGNAIVLTINRNGTTIDITVVLGEYTPSQPRTDYSYVYDL